MKNKLLIALFLGFWCICAVLISHNSAAAGVSNPDETSRSKQNRFIVPSLTDSLSSKDICNTLPLQYQGKIFSCRYIPSGTALEISYDSSFPEIEILQVLRLNGYEAHYFVNGNTRVFLDASGTNALSEQVKQ